MAQLGARAISWTESGLVPDTVIRQGIRRLLEQKRRDIRAGDIEHAAALTDEFVDMMNRAPVAPVPELANEQHYEVPAEFYGEILGPRRKYSCCFWDESTESLDEAERAALGLTLQRAAIENGHKVLDLGCGWGSLSLWIAETLPDCSVTTVSNSHSQRDYIVEQCRRRGIHNVKCLVADMNDFAATESYDRVVSVEMFEHMRNYGELFRRIASWLRPGGRFFLHIFSHRTTPYEYRDNGPDDWMSRHFFSGGMMPGASLPLRFQHDLQLDRQWAWSGLHYARTCRAWLDNMDGNRDRIMPILAATYGDEAERWWMRWRMFFMACEELFRFNDGGEWFVSHYRFERAQ